MLASVIGLRGERDRDPRAELERSVCSRGHEQREERVVGRLGGEPAVVARRPRAPAPPARPRRSRRPGCRRPPSWAEYVADPHASRVGPPRASDAIRVGVTPRRYRPSRWARALPQSLSPSSSRRSRSARSRSASRTSSACRSRRRRGRARARSCTGRSSCSCDRPADDRTLDAALADLDRAARRARRRTPSSPSLELTDDDWALFHADAEALVRRYFELEDPTTVHPIGLELKLEAELGPVRLRGIIDRLELDADGELVVTDYKTGRCRRSASRQEPRAASTSTRCCASRCSAGARRACSSLPVEARGDHRHAHRADDHAASQRKTTALWSAIARRVRARRLPPPPGRLCDFCTFKPYCPAFGGDPVQAAELRGPGTVIAPALPLANA